MQLCQILTTKAFFVYPIAIANGEKIERIRNHHFCELKPIYDSVYIKTQNKSVSHILYNQSCE